MRTVRRRPGLGRYVEARLGATPGEQARNFLARPFGASSFAGFWRYWNPVYGYVLYYWSYRPLRQVLPRAAAMWLTFVLCGFVLHDLVVWAIGRTVAFPSMALLFGVFGLGAVASEALRMDTGELPFAGRAAVNVAYLGASVAIWWVLLALVRG
jgi:hypothetical protein